MWFTPSLVDYFLEFELYGVTVDFRKSNQIKIAATGTDPISISFSPSRRPASVQ